MRKGSIASSPFTVGAGLGLLPALVLAVAGSIGVHAAELRDDQGRMSGASLVPVAGQALCPAPPRVAGPDGLPGTADDGWIVEDFDTERDGTPGISLANLPRGTPGVLNDTIGVWVGTAPGGTATLAAVACGGFRVPPVDPECRIDPDNDMDWHIHCPAGECANATGHVTPSDGNFAFSGWNSLHWGHHFDPGSREGDSTKFRQMAAFMTEPIHLTTVPAPGDLELSFFHVAAMMDNNTYNAPPGQANDFGDVHIQVFDPAAADGGQWGFWDRLVPFQNVYDHIPLIWSAFGTAGNYCILTPTDTGPGGYAPRGYKETLCYPNGIWSHCGNAHDTSSTYQCDGPGLPGSAGSGLWVQSRFSLSDFLGRTVRIRWIAQSWEFDCCHSSYYELGEPWTPEMGDDGWWVDDIKITGAVQHPPQGPVQEVCNGVDDDCDGVVDDDLGETTCGTGACARVVANCAGGTPQSCVPGEPSPELCDGLDNDCDGLADEGIGVVVVSVEPPRLWPPNHRMVGIHATVVLSGACPAACPSPPSVVLAAVTSDEPDNAPGDGDGDTVNDIQGAAVGTADFDLELRAERATGGDGRRYQVSYTATDCFGAIATGTAEVLVPRDQGGVSEPVVVSAVDVDAGTRLAWDSLPEAFSYRVVRGNTAGLRDAGDFFDTGPLACIRSGSASPTTEGSEDAENPPLGQAFFYLVAYSDQWGDIGFGSADVPKPRVAGTGGCP